MTIGVATGLAVAAIAPVAHAAPSARAMGSATATIIRPLNVVAVADMDFGTITHTPGTPGTVTVTPMIAGASFGGGASAICVATDCATAHAARFTVSGEPQRAYTIQLPGSIMATGSGATSLIVQALTLRTINAGNTGNSGNTSRLDAGGTDGFDVGGTISVSAVQAPARYRASFAVIVSYI